MPVTDRREPAVYVTIEDKSYVESTIESGRSVYSVILCNRGPHNRIVNVTSKSQFHKLFGKPNFRLNSQTFYQIDKALDYTSSVLVTRVVPEDSYWANSYIREVSTGNTVNEEYTFTNNSNTVVCGSVTAYNSVSIGEWIYNSNDTIAVAAQVISKKYDAATTTYSFILDRVYAGSAGTEVPLIKFSPYEYQSMTEVTTSDLFVNPDNDVVFYFYANGAGKYYNNLVIRGVRNTELEKYYIDDDGNIMYKYVFMDIAVYELQDNGSYLLQEGPWTVSLIPRYPDGSPVKDLTSGSYLFIEDVINSNSDLIRCVASTRDSLTGEPKGEFPSVTKMISDADAEDRRLQVMLMLSSSSITGTSNVISSTPGVVFENGTDGTGLYDSGGNYNPNDALLGLVSQAFKGTLESVDGSVEQLPESLYAWYTPDYIVCGGFPAEIQEAAAELAANREDCIVLADTGGYKSSLEKDLDARADDVPWNQWTAMLYVQWRRIFDEYTGQKIWVSPVYHAIERHLYCDAAYFIAEPVAGIEKGAISDPIDLAYKANHTERGDLLDKELNCIIVEPQGKYILSQFTTWKRLSVLKRGHVAKFVAYVKKTLPTLLKDILQRKATAFWINQAKLRTTAFLNKFVEGSVERYSILKSFNVSVEFNESSSELNVMVDMTPIRSIERINVYISVY